MRLMFRTLELLDTLGHKLKLEKWSFFKRICDAYDRRLG